MKLAWYLLSVFGTVFGRSVRNILGKSRTKQKVLNIGPVQSICIVDEIANSNRCYEVSID